MAARLWLEVQRLPTDVEACSSGVEKWRDGRFVGFEGSYGYGRDRVTTGWQKASLRALDKELSQPSGSRCRHAPTPTCCVPARWSRSTSRSARRPLCFVPVNNCVCSSPGVGWLHATRSAGSSRPTTRTRRADTSPCTGVPTMTPTSWFRRSRRLRKRARLCEVAFRRSLEGSSLDQCAIVRQWASARPTDRVHHRFRNILLAQTLRRATVAGCTQ